MIYRDNPLIAVKYKSKRWQKLRKEYMMTVNGLCQRCKGQGIINPATILHHKVYVTDNNYNDDNIFFNSSNLEALCKKCHNKEHFGQEELYFFDKNGDIIVK